MDAFTLLDIEGANNSKMKPRVPNTAVEIARGCQLTLEQPQDELFARYVVSLSKFKSYFAAKLNIMLIQRL